MEGEDKSFTPYFCKNNRRKNLPNNCGYNREIFEPYQYEVD